MRIVVVSDIHGFYDEFMRALDKVNFNPETDLLVSCGDAMDRGTKPRQVLEYLNSLPNKVLIHGNHETMMTEAISRGYFDKYDIHNGTAYTTYDFSNKPNAGKMSQTEILKNLSKDKVYKQYMNSLVNYYETEKYIFVHSWIPVNQVSSGTKMGDFLMDYYNPKYVYNPGWRNASDIEWEDMRWPNPLNMVKEGLNQTGKTIVMGHWHCSSGWAMEFPEEFSEFGKDKPACFDPYYYKEVNKKGKEEVKMIMIDACTAYSGKCNVLVLEDNLLEETKK